MKLTKTNVWRVELLQASIFFFRYTDGVVFYFNFLFGNLRDSAGAAFNASLALSKLYLFFQE